MENNKLITENFATSIGAESLPAARSGRRSHEKEVTADQYQVDWTFVESEKPIHYQFPYISHLPFFVCYMIAYS